MTTSARSRRRTITISFSKEDEEIWDLLERETSGSRSRQIIRLLAKALRQEGTGHGGVIDCDELKNISLQVEALRDEVGELRRMMREDKRWEGELEDLSALREELAWFRESSAEGGEDELAGAIREAVSGEFEGLSSQVRGDVLAELEEIKKVAGLRVAGESKISSQFEEEVWRLVRASVAKLLEEFKQQATSISAEILEASRDSLLSALRSGAEDSEAATDAMRGVATSITRGMQGIKKQMNKMRRVVESLDQESDEDDDYDDDEEDDDDDY